jgi:DNA-binding MarR family transcriptional regulator
MKRQSIGRYISSIYRYQSIIINKLFEQYGISSGQCLFFEKIAKNPGINQKRLSELVKIDRANTHRAIKKLEELGYIYTIRDETDKRIIKSYLTEKGEALIPVIKKGLLSVTEIMVENFEDTEKEAIFKLFQKIEENVQNHVKSSREDNRYGEK